MKVIQRHTSEAEAGPKNQIRDQTDTWIHSTVLLENVDQICNVQIKKTNVYCEHDVSYIQHFPPSLALLDISNCKKIHVCTVTLACQNHCLHYRKKQEGSNSTFGIQILERSV